MATKIVYGTGEHDGNTLSTGASGAFRYIYFDSATFNESTGKTTLNFHIATWVDYGNFNNSTFQSWGYFGDKSFSVSGPSGNPYDSEYGSVQVAHNGSQRFQEGCGYYSSSSGQLESTLDVTWKPTLPTYTVSYNANSGSGAPSSQTKTWGTALTLSSVKPTRTGYTFKGWATSQARANNGTVDYASGASYSGNAALNLWAVWQIGSYTITYKANGGTGSDFTQSKNYGATVTLASSGFTRTNYTLSKWNTSANGGGTSYAKGASYSTNANLTLYAIWLLDAPSAPTGFSVTRASDTKINLSWTRPSNASATWQKVYIQRQVDGGSWADLTNIAGTSTSYSDTTTTANHSYKYRIRAYNNGGSGQYSSYATQDGVIYNTPSAPSAITATREDDTGMNVVLYLTNAARTATGYDVQCSTDASTWTSSGITVTSTVGSPVTQINITMASGGAYYYRVRNKRTSPTALNSAWTVSNLVVTIVPPNPPTLDAPTSGGVVQYGTATGTTVNFAWTHNPIDGSPQSAAQLRYSTNGGTSWIATVTLTTASTYSLTYAFALNDTVTWQVRTKGAADGYGDWSASSTFAIYQSPSIAITAPSATIISVPVAYSLTYADASGEFASGTVSVLYNNATVYTEQLDSPTGSTITGSIYASEFLPEDGKTYTFKFTAASNTTLSTTAQVTLSVDMEAPYIGTIQVTNDPETGYVSVNYGWDSSSGGQPVDHVTLYRVTDEGRKELATSMTNNASCLDMYAPLNTDYAYLVVTVGTNASLNQYERTNRLNTGWWFVYYGSGKIAKAKWNPNGSKKVSRPQQELVDYIGRKFPVSYDGTAVREEGTTDFAIIDREYAKQFYDMVSEIGSGVYKSGDGEVFHANFQSISTASTHHRNQPYGSLSLPYTRIDGEML